MLKSGPMGVWAALFALAPAAAWTVPASSAQSALNLPALRDPSAAIEHVPPPIPLPQVPDTHDAVPQPPGADVVSLEIASLRQDMADEVPHLLHLRTGRPAELQDRAAAMLRATSTTIDTPQLVVVVDRDPSIETLALMVARPGNAPWSLIGAAHVSTGQSGRKDYYITPVGVFRHTDAILDFRALGTYNEHHVRGLGLAGMRVWDFGWQWAIKGWHNDIAGGDIRLQMHATDPDLLEGRLGRPASEGCVRVSSAMNKFLDSHGVLDADYERAAITDIRYRALLKPDRTPSLLAGRLLIVIDSGEPIDEPPTQASRPANWPPPPTDVPPAAAVQE
jgi:lipoprotein-anchoring transpeptidase ErfK/SrfK